MVIGVFDKNGIYFEHSESWQLTEELWDDDISTLTFEDENGIYMIDIYHAGKGPELLDYANKHFSCFKKELPFLSKIIGDPVITNISVDGVSGLTLEFMVKSFFLLKTNYLNPIFRVSSQKSISFISAQYPKSEGNELSVGLGQVLASYHAN
ncbi:hypothetical protein SOHN41_03579 [Shewanella sp. HN-41]|nr:hypothetical protein SOHN41_03579 [Shewanella sp. HN-41]